MATLSRFAVVFLFPCVLNALALSAWADANFVAIDGSNPYLRAADFGYRIDVAAQGPHVIVRVILDVKAAKGFQNADLKLSKTDKTVVETTLALLPGDGEPGANPLKSDKKHLKWTVDTQAADDGLLEISSAWIDGQPPIKNFAGFRLSMKTLIAKAKLAR